MTAVDIRVKVKRSGSRITTKSIPVVNNTKVQVRTSQNVSKVTAVVAGPRGPRGLSGAEAQDKHFETSFSNTASVTVSHNLGKRPAVTVLDSANDEVVGEIHHVSINQLTISFTAPFSGTVLCN